MFDHVTFQKHPMYQKWNIVMRRALLDTLQGVESLNVSDDEKQQWLDFRKQIQTQTHFSLPEIITNRHFITVWEYKGQALADMLHNIDWLMKRHSPPLAMMDLYREKYEQALDWLTRRTDRVPPLLRVDIPNNNDPSSVEGICDAIATSILKKRSEWVNKMAMIEQVRREYEDKVFETDDIETIKQFSRECGEQIHKMDRMWI